VTSASATQEHSGAAGRARSLCHESDHGALVDVVAGVVRYQQRGLGGSAAALVLATQEFVANWRAAVTAPLECCIAGADGQPWGRIGQRGLVAFQLVTLAASPPDF
jgi:hypothetical protein